MKMNTVNHIDQLRRLYNTNPAARAILDMLAARERNATVTKVETAHANIVARGTSCGFYEVVRALKELAELGYGKFKAGRKGHKSRIEWAVDVVSLGQVAAGVRSDIQTLNVGNLEDTDDQFAHDATTSAQVPISSSTIQPDARGQQRPSLKRIVFPIRRDLDMELLIPHDFGQKDAQRLADFVKTLAFDDRAQ